MESQNGEAESTWHFLGSPSPGLHTLIYSFCREQEAFLPRESWEEQLLEAQGYDCPAFWTQPGVTHFELSGDLEHEVGLETPPKSF